MNTEEEFVKALIRKDINRAYEIFMSDEIDVNLTEYEGLKADLSLIHLAVKNGQIGIVFDLLTNYNIFINVKTYINKDTPLLLACQSNNLEMIKLLLTYGANCNLKNSEGITPIIMAARNGYFEIVTYLASSGGDINSFDKNGNSAFLYAAKYGNLRALKSLSDSYFINIAEMQDYGRSPLFEVVKSGNIKALKYLLSQNRYNINNIIDGDNIITLAASLGNLEMVKYFASSSLYCNFFDTSKKACLTRAAENGNIEVLAYLLESFEFFETKVINGLSKKILIENPADHYSVVAYAAKNGNLEIVKYLYQAWKVNLRKKIPGRDDNSVTLASLNGHVGVLKYLHSIDKTLVEESFERSILKAASSGRVDVVRYLLTEVEIPEDLVISDLLLEAYAMAFKNEKLDVAWYIAEFSEDVREAQKKLVPDIIIDQLETFNDKSFDILQLISKALKFDFNQPIIKEDNSLILASSYGRIDIVKFLLKISQLNIDTKNNIGMTPLMIAASSGNIELVKLLIAKGANPKLVNNKGNDALKLAVNKGKIEVVKYIAENCDVDFLSENKAGNNLLTIAIINGYNEIASYLLENYEFNLEEANDNNYTPLMLAIENNSLEIVSILVAKGVNLNVKNHRGISPIEMAALLGKLEIVKYFLKECSERIELSKVGYSILDIAVSQGKIDLVEYLYDKDFPKEKLLALAIRENHMGILHFLLEKGCDTEEHDSEGNTALIDAVIMQNIVAIKALVAKGANVNARNDAGESVLKIAMENKGDFAIDILKFLVIECKAEIQEEYLSDICWVLDPELENHIELYKMQDSLQNDTVIGEVASETDLINL